MTQSNFDDLKVLEARWKLTGNFQDEIKFCLAQERKGILVRKPFPLLHKIDLEDEYNDSVDLYWFIRKVSFGSDKAPDMLERVQNALVKLISLKVDPESSKTYFETLQMVFPSLPPFFSPQNWMDQAIHPKIFTEQVIIREKPIYSYDHYNDQWNNEPQKYETLIHDSLIFCWENWSSQKWLECTEKSLKHYQNYNSLNLTVTMFFTIAAWSARLW